MMSQIIRAVRVIQTGITDFRKHIKLLRSEGHFSKNTNIRASRTSLLTEIINAQPFKFTDQSMPKVFVSGNRTIARPARLKTLRGTREDQLLCHGGREVFFTPCLLRETNQVRQMTMSREWALLP